MKIKLVPNARVSVGAIAESTDVKNALISFVAPNKGWGYSGLVNQENEFIFKKVHNSLRRNSFIVFLKGSFDDNSIRFEVNWPLNLKIFIICFTILSGLNLYFCSIKKAVVETTEGTLNDVDFSIVTHYEFSYDALLLFLLPYTLGMIWYNLELKNITDHFQMSFKTSNVHVV